MKKWVICTLHYMIYIHIYEYGNKNVHIHMLVLLLLCWHECIYSHILLAVVNWPYHFSKTVFYFSVNHPIRIIILWIQFWFDLFRSHYISITYFDAVLRGTHHSTFITVTSHERHAISKHWQLYSSTDTKENIKVPLCRSAVRGNHRRPVHSNHKWPVMRPYSMSWRLHVAAFHDDVIKWQHFPRYWPFVRGIGEFPAQRPVTQSFDVFFDLRPNKRLSKQSWGWWFETPPWSLWRHGNARGPNCRVTPPSSGD